MRHDDPSGGPDRPDYTTPTNTGWDGRASKRAEAVLCVIPALLRNSAVTLLRIRFAYVVFKIKSNTPQHTLLCIISFASLECDTDEL